MCLSHAQLPGQTGILDARPGAGTGATIVSRDDNVLSFALQGEETVLSKTSLHFGKSLTLATPEATTPTPTSDTNLTLMRALGLEHLRS